MLTRSLSTLRRPLLVSISALAFGLTTGCNEDEALRAFRDAAASSLQNGLSSIAGGLIDGAFAVFELGADETGGTDTSGGDTTGGESTTDASAGE